MEIVTTAFLYLILIAAAIVVISDTKWRPASFGLLGLASFLALLALTGALPVLVVPSSAVIAAAPLVVIWVLAGVLVGCITLFVQRGYSLLALGSAALLLSILFLTGWPVGLGNPNLGWGFFAIPLLVTGALLAYNIASRSKEQIAYVLANLWVLGSVFVPVYLRAMDGTELERSYIAAAAPQSDPGRLVATEVLLTSIYILGLLALLLVPWLIARARREAVAM